MRTPPRGFWPALALAMATIPVAGLFTLSNIFFVRDLAIAFRSRFLFVRHSIYSGSFPFWDPYPAHGQPAVNDALYQLFHLPSLAIRLLLPGDRGLQRVGRAAGAAVRAGDVSVPAPPRVAAGRGVRRHRVRGVRADRLDDEFPEPVVVDRRGAVRLLGPGARVRAPHRARDGAARADRLVPGARRRAGDARGDAGDRRRLRRVGRRAGGATSAASRSSRSPRCAGLLLSAIQYVPMLAAGRESMRSTMEASDFWAFHPLALFELLVPHFFGDYFHSNLREVVWMVALNSDRDPFYYTMYVGVPVLLLAAVAMLSGRPRTVFWTVVVVACAVAALGPHTPIYPALQALVPPLRTLPLPGQVPVARVVRAGHARGGHAADAPRRGRAAPRRPHRVDRRRRGRAGHLRGDRVGADRADDADPRVLPPGGVGQGAGADPGGRVPAVPRASAADLAAAQADCRHVPARDRRLDPPRAAPGAGRVRRSSRRSTCSRRTAASTRPSPRRCWPSRRG